MSTFDDKPSLLPSLKGTAEAELLEQAALLLSGSQRHVDQAVQRLARLVQQSPAQTRAIWRQILAELHGEAADREENFREENGREEASPAADELAEPDVPHPSESPEMGEARPTLAAMTGPTSSVSALPGEIEDLDALWAELGRRLQAQGSTGDKSPNEVWLVLGRGGWQMVEAAAPPVGVSAGKPFSAQHCPRGTMLKQWWVESPEPVSLGLGPTAPAAPALTHLKLSLAEIGAKIRLELHVEQPDPSREQMWRLAFRLEPGAQVPSLRLALGDAVQTSTGTRTLTPQRPVEFDVDPPVDRSWWVWIRWRQGEQIQQQRAEIPLLRARGEDEQ